MTALLAQWVQRQMGWPLAFTGLSLLVAAACYFWLTRRGRGKWAGKLKGGNLSVLISLTLLLLVALTYGAASIAGERRSGQLRRLLAAPVKPGEIVAGKIAGHARRDIDRDAAFADRVDGRGETAIPVISQIGYGATRNDNVFGRKADNRLAKVDRNREGIGIRLS